LRVHDREIGPYGSAVQAYAAAGIPTFPLGGDDGKRPLVRRPMQFGIAASVMGRAQLQAIKIYRKLEGEGNWRDGAPPKPKGMRWWTYERLSEKLDRCNARFDANWMESASRFLARR
jgi:hypothetical protein